MNISGYQDSNYHDGNTQILGDLVIDGKLTIGGATGQSEYLDSGDYKGTILGVPSHWLSMGLSPGTQYRYEKNGNIIHVHLFLRGEIKANIQYPQISVNVPSTDLFNVGHTGSAYAYSSFILPTGRQIYTSINNLITTSGINGSTSILVYYEGNSATNNQEFVDFFVHLVYKLDGPDIPATVLVSGGSGQGDVQNPMLETLNAGGYDILNVGTLSATFVSAPNVLTNPLTSTFDLNNNTLINGSTINAVQLNTDFIQALAPSITISMLNDVNFGSNNIINLTNITLQSISSLGDIVINNNIDMKGSNILFPTNITGVGTIDNTLGSLNIKGAPLYLQSQTPGVGIKVDDNLDFQYPINSKIKNCNEIKTVGQQLRIVGGPLILENDSGATDIFISNSIDMNGKDIKDVVNTTTTNILTENIYSNTPGTAIQIKDDTSYNEKSIFQLAGIINAGLELTINTGTVSFSDSKISEPGLIQKTGTLTFDSASSYNFLNYVDFTTKRLNGIKFIRSQADFQTLTSLSGIYVIVGAVAITSQLSVSGHIHIQGYNTLSSLDFNIPLSGFNNYCLRNYVNSGNVYISNIRITNQSLSYETLSFTDTNRTSILKYDNIIFENNKNLRVSRIEGFDMCNITNNIVRNNYGGVSILFEFVAVKNMLFTANQFLNNYQLGDFNNYYLGKLIFLSGSISDITVSNNLISTYGLNSLEGFEISSVGTTVNRAVIANNVFDYRGGALQSNLVFFDTSIHKGIICSDNTNIDTCRAYLEGISNANTVFTPTVSGSWTPIVLGPGFTVTEINRFVPGLSPYSFEYDSRNPIRSSIVINCQADHGTGGIDTVRLGLYKNGAIVVYVEGQISASQITQLSLTTSIKLVLGDTLQLVCQNLSGGTNAQGFRAVSLNASLTEVS